MNAITQKALELCWEIEKLPASEQQTELIIRASNLYNMLVADEGGKLLDSIEPSEKAKEIGARVNARLRERILTLHEADKSHDPRQDEYIPGLGWVPKVKY